MVSIIALLITAFVITFVLFWSGRHGDPKRSAGTSLRRGAHSHTTAKGRPKVSYRSRGEAEASAQNLTRRGQGPLNVYRCDTCSGWHVGHRS